MKREVNKQYAVKTHKNFKNSNTKTNSHRNKPNIFNKKRIFFLKNSILENIPPASKGCREVVIVIKNTPRLV